MTPTKHSHCAILSFLCFYLFSASSLCAQSAAEILLEAELPAGQKPAPDTPKPVIIDVRPSENFLADHVDDAINIPYEDLEEQLAVAELFKDKTIRIYVYCTGGGLAEKALELLQRLGFANSSTLCGIEDARQKIRDAYATKSAREAEIK